MRSATISKNDRNIDKMLKGLRKRLRNAKSFEKAAGGLDAILSVFVFQDIMNHFSKEMGPEGAWKAKGGGKWSKAYTKYLKSIGRDSNKSLQFTGRLKLSFLPTNRRAKKNKIIWFNPVVYARAHDEGVKSRNLNARPYMWLSDRKMKQMMKASLKFVNEGKK